MSVCKGVVMTDHAIKLGKDRSYDVGVRGMKKMLGSMNCRFWWGQRIVGNFQVPSRGGELEK